MVLYAWGMGDEWFLHVNGRTDGPFSGEAIRQWAATNPRVDAWIRQSDEEPWQQVTKRPARSWVGYVVLAGVLLGGCSFIVAEPVMALAVVFVGIPFVLVVGWVGVAMLSRSSRP